MKLLFFWLCMLSTTSPAFAALCSKTPKNSPCTPDPDAVTETVENDIRQLLADAKDADPDVNRLKAEYLAVRDNKDAGIEEKFAACEAYRLKKMAQDQLYVDAINKTAALYHVYPKNSGQVLVAKSSDPKLKWMSGLTAKWDPQVTDSGPGVTLAVKVWGTDGNDHYGGLVNMEPAPRNQSIEPRFAVTLPDGRTLILKGTFDLALDKNHGLGFLASIIFHETRHFNYLSRDCADGSGTCSWASETEDERDAYKEQNRLADVFGLSKADRAAFIGQWQKFDADVTAGRLESFDPDPSDAADWKYYYPTQINLEEEYKKLKEALDAPNRHEIEKTQAQAATAAAVKQCGFAPHFERRTAHGNDPSAFYFVGYDASRELSVQYNFPASRTIDELKVSLMLTRTCWDLEPEYLRQSVEHADTQCNDGIAILNAHAGDAAFLAAIGAQVTVMSNWRFGVPGRVDTYNYACVSEKIRQIRFPLDSQNYERLFEAEIKRNVKQNKKAADDAGRALQAEEENKRRGNSKIDDDERGHSTPQKGCGQDGTDPPWCLRK